MRSALRSAALRYYPLHCAPRHLSSSLSPLLLSPVPLSECILFWALLCCFGTTGDLSSCPRAECAPATGCGDALCAWIASDLVDLNERERQGSAAQVSWRIWSLVVRRGSCPGTCTFVATWRHSPFCAPFVGQHSSWSHKKLLEISGCTV